MRHIQFSLQETPSPSGRDGAIALPTLLPLRFAIPQWLVPVPLAHVRHRTLNRLPPAYFTRPHLDHIGTRVPTTRLPGTYRPIQSGHVSLTQPDLPRDS